MLETTFGRQFERAIGGPLGFRHFLEQRGPIFVKIGQFLALRPDLIPREYCQELLSLFERVQPFPWAEARQIILEDLNGEPAELFGYFNPNPVAAGSLAQTYFARLRNGAEVAVKVLRPGIELQVARDLRHARRLAKVLEVSGTRLIVSPSEVVKELESWLLQELDLQHELSNLQRFRRLTRRDRVQVVPRPYPALSGRRVLTAEYIRGVHVVGLLVPADEPRQLPSDQVAAGIDKDQFAERLIHSCLTQIFRYRFFHADVHPGNLLALPDGKIAFVDFGLCETLDDTVRRKQMQYLSALYEGNSDQVFRSLQDIIMAGPAANAEGLRRDFFAAVRNWSLATTDGVSRQAQEPYSSPVANYMISIMRAARRNGYTIPTRILAMYRALLTAESVASELSGRADLHQVGRAFIEKLRSDELLHILDGKNLKQLLTDHLSLWSEYPNQVNQILGDLADNRFVLKVSMSENAELRQVRNRRARAIATAVVAVSVALLIPYVGSSEGGFRALAWFLGGVLVVLYALVYLDYRRLK